MSYISHRLSAAMWARVLILWLTLALAALVLGAFAIGMGMFVRSNIYDELAIHRDRRIAQDRIRPQPGFQPGQVDERLEGGARLALGLNRAIELAARIGLAADHDPHRAAMAQHDHGALPHAPALALAGQRPVQGFFRHALQPGIEGR